VHGAISGAKKDQQKVAARLSIPRLDQIARATGIPLVLHGGTGIAKEILLEAARHGIAKINVATAIRQPYERAVKESAAAAARAVYEATVEVVREQLEVAGSARKLAGAK
jgi:fructose/tagatose bisphosphate aldolase